MVSVNDKNYDNYEVYYLMNFVLMPPIEQLKLFYLKDIIPVEYDMHHRYVNLDERYNPDVTNPIYQLFVAGLSYTGHIMYLLEDLYGSGDIYDDINNYRESLFNEELCNVFFEEVTFNTSVEGFLHGVFWSDLRVRAFNFLDKCQLLDEICFSKPIMFSSFLYPLDFIEYKKVPRWSTFGMAVSQEEWTVLKNITLDLYKDLEIND